RSWWRVGRPPGIQVVRVPLPEAEGEIRGIVRLLVVRQELAVGLFGQLLVADVVDQVVQAKRVANGLNDDRATDLRQFTAPLRGETKPDQEQRPLDPHGLSFQATEAQHPPIRGNRTRSYSR